MEKISIVALITLTLIVQPLPALAQTSTPTTDLTVSEIAQQVTTPEALAKFLKREFKFRNDEKLFGQIDYWQSADEFIARRLGDCEDYAILAKEILTRNGIEAHVFSIFGPGGYAHTICVFLDENGRYNVLNQEKLRYTRARTLADVARSVNSSWTYGGIVEKKGVRGYFVEQITNSNPASPIQMESTPFNF